jgi:hypothetical protein
MIIVLVWFMIGAATGFIAGGKGRSDIGWFVLGILFGPFSLIVVACLPAVKPEETDARPCPFCAEPIKMAAVVCKHCARDVPAQLEVEPVEPGPITKSLERFY